jgi:hypothetical protein
VIANKRQDAQKIVADTFALDATDALNDLIVWHAEHEQIAHRAV